MRVAYLRKRARDAQSAVLLQQEGRDVNGDQHVGGGHRDVDGRVAAERPPRQRHETAGALLLLLRLRLRRRGWQEQKPGLRRRVPGFPAGLESGETVFGDIGQSRASQGLRLHQPWSL